MREEARLWRWGPHRQRQGVLAVVEGVLKHHGSQHVVGAVIVFYVVLKVLLGGKATDCRGHQSCELPTHPFHLKNLDISGHFQIKDYKLNKFL